MWYILSFLLIFIVIALLKILFVPLSVLIIEFFSKKSDKPIFIKQKISHIICGILSVNTTLWVYENYILERVTDRAIDNFLIAEYLIVLMIITLINSLIGYSEDKRNGFLMTSSNIFRHGLKSLFNYYFALNFATPIGILVYILIFKLLL